MTDTGMDFAMLQKPAQNRVCRYAKIRSTNTARQHSDSFPVRVNSMEDIEEENIKNKLTIDDATEMADVFESIKAVCDKNNNQSKIDDEQEKNMANEKSSKKRVERRVSFADALGLDLASIRIMTEGRDTPPYLENCLSNLNMNEEEPKPTLTPCFSQPITNFSRFMSRLEDNYVSLESVDVIHDVVTGVVKVKNLAYEKLVQVWHTADNWRTQGEVSCYYVNPAYGVCKKSTYDVFSFQIDIDPSWTRLDFCILFRCEGQEFWDNNDDANYKMVLKTQS